MMRGQCPLLTPGCPRVHFGFFENMYGQWKSGARSDQNVLMEFGTLWLELFRMWKTWGLESIYSALREELDMSTEGNGSVVPRIRERPTLTIPLRVPFSVIRPIFHGWQAGQLVARFGLSFSSLWLHRGSPTLCGSLCHALWNGM